MRSAKVIQLFKLAVLLGMAWPLAQAAPDKATLAANERLQGTLEVDVGTGAKTMQSVATTVDADLGAKTAARLKTAEGQQKLADAKASIKSTTGSSAASKVSASDIQDLADRFAGKTMYSSQMMHLAIVKAYTVTLDGKAADGSRAALSMLLDEKDFSVKSASFSYIPDGKRRMESFDSSKKSDPVQVKIDQIKRIDDKTFAMSGSFTAGNLKAGVLAKKLKGQTMASASGRFSFAEVAVKPGK